MRHVLRLIVASLLLLQLLAFTSPALAAHESVVFSSIAGSGVAIENTERTWTHSAISGNNRLVVVYVATRTVAVTYVRVNGQDARLYNSFTQVLEGDFNARVEIWTFPNAPTGALTMTIRANGDADISNGFVRSIGVSNGSERAPIRVSAVAFYPDSPGAERDVELGSATTGLTFWTAIGTNVGLGGAGRDADQDATSAWTLTLVTGNVFARAFREAGGTDEDLFTWATGISTSDVWAINFEIGATDDQVPDGDGPTGGGIGNPFDVFTPGNVFVSQFGFPRELGARCLSSGQLDWLLPTAQPGSNNVTLEDTRRIASLAIQYIVNWGDGLTTFSVETPITHTYKEPDIYTITLRISYQTGAIEILTAQVDVRGNNCSLQGFIEEWFPILLGLVGLSLIAALIVQLTRRSRIVKAEARRRLRRILLAVTLVSLGIVVGIGIYASAIGVPL